MKDRAVIIVFALGILFVLVNCNQSNSKKNNQVNLNKELVKAETTNEDLSKGFRLLESSCFTCHSPDVNIKNKVAPTMATIKKHYVTEGVTKESFTNAFIEFVNEPVEGKVKIPQAIERFGLMPRFVFLDEQLAQMASYIYHTKLEAAGWYEKNYELERLKHKINLEELSYSELGKNVAMSTKSILGKNLKNAIQNNGTANAVEFCNERAYQLTDSMSIAFNTKIKRVSDKARNPLNRANKSELKYIDNAKQILAKGGKINAQVQEVNGKMVAYYPIVTNKMCLQCHGQPKTQIQGETLKKLNNLYPKDMAKGYTENEIRGIWMIEMLKK